MNNDHFFISFAIALGVILLACALVGSLAKYLGQPRVVGEMIAGVCLGPSLFGFLFPDLQQWVFPGGAQMTILFALSQLGLVLYMFTVGLEFDVSLLKQKFRSGAAVSAAGIAAPLVLGSIIAIPLLADHGTYFTPGIELPVAMLFCGAAIATTAFPMLARIIEDRRISKTPLGTVALSAGAADDAAAWIILAVIVAVVSGQPLLALVAIGGGLLFVLVMVGIGKKALNALVPRGEGLRESTLIIILVLVVATALYTNTVGIHSIFGGFVLGAVMPRTRGFSEQIRTKLQPVVKGLLLPLFFVYSGLNTQIGLLNTPALWAVAGLIFVVAVLGKGVACFAAAKACKVPNREALAIGSLMNARGLMELILLNVALQAGVITKTLFTMLVLMAVVTTLMATPLFNLFYGRHQRAKAGARDRDGESPAAEPSDATIEPQPDPAPAIPGASR